MTKEEIYDAEINPLMTKIIAIAQEHKIAMVASFALAKDEDDNYYLCTTCLTTDPYEPPPQFKEMVKILYDY